MKRMVNRIVHTVVRVWWVSVDSSKILSDSIDSLIIDSFDDSFDDSFIHSFIPRFEGTRHDTDGHHLKNNIVIDRVINFVLTLKKILHACMILAFLRVIVVVADRYKTMFLWMWDVESMFQKEWQWHRNIPFLRSSVVLFRCKQWMGQYEQL